MPSHCQPCDSPPKPRQTRFQRSAIFFLRRYRSNKVTILRTNQTPLPISERSTAFSRDDAKTICLHHCDVLCSTGLQSANSASLPPKTRDSFWSTGPGHRTVHVLPPRLPLRRTIELPVHGMSWVADIDRQGQDGTKQKRAPFSREKFGC